MDDLTGRAVMKAVKSYNKDHPHKKYKESYEMVDGSNGAVRARCDVVGNPAFQGLDIIDHRGLTWTMRPNRKIAPTRWSISDPNQRLVIQMSQKILGHLINPIHKVFLVLSDESGKEILRLVDPRDSISDRLFGAGPLKWVLMEGERPVAKLGTIPRKKVEAKGFRAKLKAFFTPADYAFISVDDKHPLEAPAALAFFILFRELDNVGGE